VHLVPQECALAVMCQIEVQEGGLETEGAECSLCRWRILQCLLKDCQANWG
jgi:hypothetical protein